MTNPYSQDPYQSAWQEGYSWGQRNPGEEQPTPPDFSAWAQDAQTVSYIGQVWQEGALAGRGGTGHQPGDSGGATGGGAGATAPAGGTGGGGQVQTDQPPAPGPVAAVDSNGQAVAQGHATQLNRAGQTDAAPHALSIAVEVGLAGLSAIPGLGAAVTVLELAHTMGCTVAVGLGGDAAAILGVSAGAGVYYTPSGEIGIYGSMAGDLGAVLGADIGECFTVVHGGSSALAGNCFAVVFGGGEVVVGSGSALFSTDGGGFIGVAGMIGLGVGWPVAAFAQYGHTWIRPIR
jgi:hypothetical protein